MASINLKSFPYSEDVACPKCKNLITLYDPEGSEYCVCTFCNSFIRFIANDTPIIQKQASPVKIAPVIKLGSTGVLNNIEFKVIGYIEKKEQASHYAWREYIIYNYQKGYATLSEFDGHWNFVAGKEFYPELDKLSNRTWDFIDYEGNVYNLFNRYTAVTTALIGEFDWDILTEKAQTAEFIAPPQIIIKEQGKGAGVADFYLGKYIEAKEIAGVFKANIEQFPQKIGIGANEPSVYAKRWFPAYKLTPVLIVLVAVIGFTASFINPRHLVMDNDYTIISDSTKVNEFKPFITPSFELNNSSSALEFLIKSNIDNNWLETTVVLVNEKDNQSWEVTESIEYYHGYEDGESWTEGSQEAEVLLSGIPAGKYHLNIYPASGDINNKNIHISIVANPVVWRNVLVTILLLFLYPLYTWFRMRNYEKKRWMNSDYSPYETEEE
ncbi:DUF4178 domain-containing protein [Mucilaginibacter sp.]|jgi:hypothetical protein|uniref:DUF4178 domain-containing protein n=1 Tax=Mucilaginibacter sp. TaxID=1882438 RepID=UPI0035681C1E